MKRTIKAIAACMAMLLAFGPAAKAQCDDDAKKCNITVVTTGQYADSWNDNAVAVYQGSTLLGTTDMYGETYGEFTFEVCEGGGDVRLVFVEGYDNWYDGEMAMTVTSAAGDVILNMNNFTNSGDYYYDGDEIYSFTPSCSGCPSPTGVTMNYTDDEVTAQWNSNPDCEGFLYRFGTSLPLTGSWNFTTGTSASEYYDEGGYHYVEVRSYCGDGDTSATIQSSIKVGDSFALPFSDNFDSYSDRSDVEAAGWYFFTGNPTWPQLSASSSYSSPKCIYTQAYMGTKSNYQGIFSPTLTMGSGVFTLSFMARGYNSGGAQNCIVGLVPGGEESISNLTTIATVSITGTTYKEYEYTLTGLNEGDMFRVVILEPQSSGYGILVDNFSVASSACPKPGDLTVTDVATTSATITWADDGSSSEWAWRISGSDEWVSTTETTVTIDDLETNTDYVIEVVTVCGEDMSKPASVSFRTPCDVSVPFSDDFESYYAVSGSYSSYNYPYCWTRYNTSDASNYYPYTFQPYSTNGAHSGTRVLYFYSYYKNDIAAPAMDFEGDEEVWFYTSSGYTATINVGYVPGGATDLSDYVSIGSVTTSNDNTWKLAHFSLEDKVPAGNWSIVLSMNKDYNYSTVYVDDFSITPKSNCAYPEGLKVLSSIVSGEVTLDWTSDGSEWEIAYGPKGFKPDGSSATIVNASSVPYTVTDLDDSTDYTFYVRTVCGEESSIWCEPVVDVRPNSYRSNVSGTDTIEGCGFTVVDDGGFDGYHSVANRTFVIRSTEPGKVINLEGWLQLGYSTYSPNQYAKLTVYDGEGTTGAKLFDLFSQDTVFDITSGSEAVTVVFSGASAYYTGPGYEFYVSCVEPLTCQSISQLQMGDIYGTKAFVTWDISVEPESYNLVLTEVATGTSTTITFDDPDANHMYMIDGLAERSDYTVTLQAVCAESNGKVSPAVAFTTKCDVGGDIYVGDPNTSSSSYYALCYTYGGSNWSSGDPNHGTGQSIFLASELENADTIFGFTYEVMYTYGYGSLPNVLVLLDTTSRSSYSSYDHFIHVDSSNIVYYGPMTWTLGRNSITFDSAFINPDPSKNLVLTVILDNPSGSYYYYGSVKTTAGSGLLNLYDSQRDPFTYPNYSLYAYNTRPNIEFNGPCGSLDCVAPIVALTSVDAHNATFSISAGGNETSWAISYRESDGSNWVEVDADYSGSSITLTGLDAGVEYVARFQTICSDEKIATRTVAFTTECETKAVPFAIGASALSLPSNSADITTCWNRSVVSGSSYYPIIDSYYKSIYFYNYYGPALVMPKLDTDLSVLELEMIYHITSDNYQLEVGYCTNPDDRTTFVPVDTVRALGANSVTHNVYVSFESVPEGLDARIYMRGSGSTNFYLDSMRVDFRPTCADLDAAALADVSAESITVKVTDNLDRGSYRFYYAANGKLDFATTDYVASTTDEATITGLTPNTEYTVWAVADCGDEGFSHPLSIGVVRTLCTSFEVNEDNPFTCGFEPTDDYECISLYKVDGVDVGSMSISEYEDYIHSGKFGLYFAANSYTKGALRAIMPTFDCTNAGESLEFAFWYRMPDGGTVTVEYRLGESGEWTKLGTEQYAMGWNRASYNIPDAKGKPVVQISLTAEATNWHSIYFDDFTFGRREACVPPTLTFEATEHEAKVSWDDPVNDSHRLDFKAASGFTWNSQTLTDGVSEAIITPLTYNSTYTVRVASVCGDTLSEFNNYNLVTPDCAHFTLYDNTDETAEKVSVPMAHEISYSALEWIVPASKIEGVTSFDKVTFFMESDKASGAYTYLYIVPTDDTVMGTTSHSSNTAQQYYGGYFNFEKGENVLQLTSPVSVPAGKSLAFILIYNHTYDNDDDSLYFTGHVSESGSLHVTSDNSSYYVYAAYLDGSYSYYSDHYVYDLRYMVPDVSVKQCIDWCYAPTLKYVTTTATTLTVSWMWENRPVQVSIRKAGDSQWGDWVTVSGASLYTFTGLQFSTDYEVRLRCDCSSVGIGYTDDVYGSGTTDFLCSVPSNITVTDVSAHSATITWTDGDIHNDKWDIYVVNDGFEKTFTATAKPFTVTGLLPGNDYKVQVRAYCGEDNSMVGDWSEVRHIQNTCAPVTGISATSNGDDVTVSWNAGDRNKKWLVAYGVKDFDDNDAIEIRTVTENHTTFEGLKRGNTYSFRVRAFCDDDWASVWSADANVALVGIDDVEADGHQVTLQPNPATSFVTLGLEGVEGAATVTILTVDGRQVQQLATNGEGSIRIDLDQYAAGTYYVRVQTAEWTATRKLIVK